MASEIKTRIKNKINTKTNWDTQLSSQILLNGELVFIRDESNNTVTAKIGDGITPFSNLPFIEASTFHNEKIENIISSHEESMKQYFYDLLSAAISSTYDYTQEEINN